MKKIINCFIILILLLVVSGCKKPNNNHEIKEIELLSDNCFKNGFTFNPADKEPQPENRYPLPYDLTYGNPSDSISWIVEQFGNIYGLADAYAIDGKKVEYRESSYIIEDPSKKMIINPELGSLTFELNASKEYTSPRKSKEAWPHLIMEQGFKEQLIVKDIETIKLRMDVTLNQAINQMSETEYDPSLHTAQYLMYIVLRSNAAADAGEFMWFGIPIYDARYKYLPESGMADAGTSGNTGKFIYQMPQNEFMPNGLPAGEKVDIDVDLMPYFERALSLAHKKNFLVNTTIDDLYLTNMNIGFEIPGTFDISVTLENFSLKAKLK